MFKQKSAESDSDSLSVENISLHSGSWSNTSSRNASPKTLRPSLKAPGMIQKLDVSRHSLSRTPPVKPTIKKVKRKAIKLIEAKLSAETLTAVDEIIREHAADKVMSVDDVNKLEDELKALLAIMLSKDDEMQAAEDLIGLKLHDLINKSFELEEHTEGAVDSDENSDKDELETDLKNITKVEELDIKNSTNDNKGFNDAKPVDVLSQLDVNEIVNKSKVIMSDVDATMGVEMNLSEIKENLTVLPERKKLEGRRKLKSWRNIADNDGNTNEFITPEENFITKANAANFEMQYWGIAENSGQESEKWDVNNKDNTWSKECVKNNDSSLSDVGKSKVDKQDESFSDKENKEYIAEKDVCKATWEEVEEVKPQRKRKLKKNPSSSLSFTSASSESSLSKVHTDIDEDLDIEKENSPVNTNFEQVNLNVPCSGENNQDVCEIFLTDSCGTSESKEDKNTTRISIDSNTPQVENLNETEINATESPGITNEDKQSGESLALKEVNNSELQGNYSLRLLKEAYNDSKVNIDEEDRWSDEADVNNRESPESDFTFEKNGNIENELTPSHSEMESEKREESLESNNEQIVDNNGVSGKGKKVSKKKAAAKASRSPLFKKEDKQKFINSDWSSFSQLSGGGPSWANNEEKINNSSNSVKHKNTMTQVEDFVYAEKLEKGEFIDSGVKYIKGKAFKIVSYDNSTDSVEAPSYITEVYQIDKSTSTDDFAPVTKQESLEFLKTCFPNVKLKELEFVLDMSGENLEWCTNLLADWGDGVNFTDEEMESIQRCPSPESIRFVSEELESGPSSLVDLCFGKIEKENIATRYINVNMYDCLKASFLFKTSLMKSKIV